MRMPQQMAASNAATSRPPAPSVVVVRNIADHVDNAELSRVFAPSPGLLGAQLLGNGVAHVKFQDPETALRCKDLYHAWNGWGPALHCEVLPNPTANVKVEGAGAGGAGGGGVKRSREDPDFSAAAAASSYASSPYDPREQYSKQQRTAMHGGAPAQSFSGIPSMGANLMPAQAAQPAAQIPMSRPAATPLPGGAPPELLLQSALQVLPTSSAQPAAQSLPGSNTQAQQQPTSSSGLAAALANLDQSQLSSLAGLLGQAASSGAPLALGNISLPLQQPPAQQALSAPAPVASQPQGMQTMGGLQYLQPQPVGAPAPTPQAGQVYNPAMPLATPQPQQPPQQQPQQVPQQQPPLGLAQFQQLLGGLQPQHLPQPQQPQQPVPQPQQQPAHLPMYTAVPQPQQPAYGAVQQPLPQQPIILSLPMSAPMVSLPQQPLQLAQQPSPQQVLGSAPPANHAPQPQLVASAEPGGGLRGAPPQAQERFPPNASSTLYIDGIPLDMTAREAEHIFRPVQGFQDLRLISKENPNRPGERSLKIFVDFVDIPTAAAAINLLQGYRIDRKDENSPVLRPVFGRPQGSRGPPGERRGGPPDRRFGGRDNDARGGPHHDARGASYRSTFAGSRSSEPSGSYRRTGGGERDRTSERIPHPEREARGPAEDRRRSRW